jgi:hypothetical protein
MDLLLGINAIICVMIISEFATSLIFIVPHREKTHLHYKHGGTRRFPLRSIIPGYRPHIAQIA